MRKEKLMSIKNFVISINKSMNARDSLICPRPGLALLSLGLSPSTQYIYLHTVAITNNYVIIQSIQFTLPLLVWTPAGLQPLPKVNRSPLLETN